ncbi:bifunctional 4-hydroxyphenylacetate degradation enzyme [Fusarium heterosporum]|uniref:Bifunctional 4-hydroxyphenylacetate degradation enzyme n=1 Tax=Fusarium heterosporum TaxID=42747 RepID=A0A8H5WBL1_FUSHE|nr:bifunctional 4-hydroxyphenylacetate degradation enzyme [Fusarium heterosporum]
MAAIRVMQYAAYVHADIGVARIGHYNLDQETIQPLSFASGTPIKNLYEVIAAGPSHIIPDGEVFAAGKVTLLPTIAGRDIMAVGKNYTEHAKEFNSSGYDSSDKIDIPSHPVIFTKRATSIIAHGEDILSHPEFSQTVDYEGEIGVIIGKPGFRVGLEDAWDHVWGYTIINDVTARERQRDHKQFFIGKSPDTFCPIGPIAVSKDNLPAVLKIETHVNGELRQSATTENLIFSIPTLIKTISEGQTLQPGDVIATGTPAGVGIGKKPPVFLKPGDEVSVSVTGLGTLCNRIAVPGTRNLTVEKVSTNLPFKSTNSAKTLDADAGLTLINGKSLNYQRYGSGEGHMVFVHGLGGTLDYWTPLIHKLSLAENNTLHLFDLEGHGLSPTHPLSKLSIESFASDIRSIFETAGINPSTPATLFAHSVGCLAALKFTLDNPELVDKLILTGPPPSPTPEAVSKSSYTRATLVRSKGMKAVVDEIVEEETSSRAKQTNPIALTAVKLSLLSQDPESYAKAVWALAGATQQLNLEKIKAETLVITGNEDTISPPSLCQQYAENIEGSKYVVLSGVGHWHVYEDIDGVAHAVKMFL